MAVDIVVRITDLHSVVRYFAVQQTIPWPVHLWFACSRGERVSADDKRRLRVRLEQLEARDGATPWLRHPSVLAREAWTLRQLVEELLVPSDERRCFAARSVDFQGLTTHVGCDADRSPFPGNYFLVTSEETRFGSGPFSAVLNGGDCVARHPPSPWEDDASSGEDPVREHDQGASRADARRADSGPAIPCRDGA